MPLSPHLFKRYSTYNPTLLQSQLCWHNYNCNSFPRSHSVAAVEYVEKSSPPLFCFVDIFREKKIIIKNIKSYLLKDSHISWNLRECCLVKLYAGILRCYNIGLSVAHIILNIPGIVLNNC